MNNQIQIFSNPKFGEIRTAISDSKEALFCLADVCKELEISNVGNVKQRLSEKGIRNVDTLTKGGLQGMTFINEANLYKCIFQSRKPDAERFQDWVCEEVLPAIRKTGGYIAAKADDTPEMIMARAVLVANDTIERQKKKIQEQAECIARNSSKVAFADAVLASKTSCLIGELAKILTQNGYVIGQNRLFDWLRENGYLGIHGERRNIPNQKYVEQGLFELKKSTHSDKDGVMHTSITTKVTPKGQSYFINKFLVTK
ncbi:MAG: phage antirepressor Ant [Bacteroides sp.]|nr:phage antirepressor Ant [Bacteroides sp.]